MAIKTTGFEYDTDTAYAVNKYEQAVRTAMYRWTTTQILDEDEAIKNKHELGNTVYLIVEGYLTLSRAGKRGRLVAFPGRNKVVHLGVQVHQPQDKRAILQRQLAVRKGGLYDLEARHEGGCTFVEGHVCLSPEVAIRLLEAGEIRWRSEAGKTVARKTIVGLLGNMTIASQQVRDRQRPSQTKMELRVSVPSNGRTAKNAGELQRWFQNEWNKYEARRARIVDVVTRELYHVADTKTKVWQ